MTPHPTATSVAHNLMQFFLGFNQVICIYFPNNWSLPSWGQQRRYPPDWSCWETRAYAAGERLPLFATCYLLLLLQSSNSDLGFLWYTFWIIYVKGDCFANLLIISEFHIFFSSECSSFRLNYNKRNCQFACNSGAALKIAFVVFMTAISGCNDQGSSYER